MHFQEMRVNFTCNNYTLLHAKTLIAAAFRQQYGLQELQFFSVVFNYSGKSYQNGKVFHNGNEKIFFYDCLRLSFFSLLPASPAAGTRYPTLRILSSEGFLMISYALFALKWIESRLTGILPFFH